MIDFSVNNTSYTGIWDPMVTIMCDVSRHQGDIDFAKMKAQGIQAVAIRCTVGDYYTDPKFETFWRDAGYVGLKRAPYFVDAPADSTGRRIAVEDQTDRFISAFGNRVPEFPIVIDCELTRGQSAEYITNHIKKSIDIVLGYYGGEITIYTSQGWWNPNVRRRDYWSNYYLHVANYTTASSPALPADWKDWDVWQWSNKGDGATYGASSASIDLNRVQYPDFLDVPTNGGGNMDDLDAFIEKMRGENIPITARINYHVDGWEEVPEPPEPPIEPPVEPPVEPPAPTKYYVQVTDDKTLAHFAVSQNAAGYPVMEIYPSEGSDPAARIKFVRGEDIQVILSSTEWIVGDGATKWYEMANDYNTGEKLYVNKDDVMKLW